MFWLSEEVAKVAAGRGSWPHRIHMETKHHRLDQPDGSEGEPACHPEFSPHDQVVGGET